MTESATHVLHTIAERGVLTIPQICEHTGLAHDAVDGALSGLIRHQKLRRFHSPSGNSYGLARGVEVARRSTPAPSPAPTPAPATAAAEAVHMQPHSGMQGKVLQLLQHSREPMPLRLMLPKLGVDLSMPVRSALKRLRALGKVTCEGHAGAGRWSVVAEEDSVSPSASIGEASPCASESTSTAPVSPPAPSSATVDAPTGPSPVASFTSGADTLDDAASAAASPAPETSRSTQSDEDSALFLRVLTSPPPEPTHGLVAGMACLAKGLRELLDYAIDEDAPNSVLKRIAEHAFNAHALSGLAAPPESRS